MSPNVPIRTTRQVVSLVICVIGTLLSLSFVSLRLIARWKHRGKWDWSDLCIGITEIFYLMLLADVCLMVIRGGAGLHGLDLFVDYGLDVVANFLKGIWIYQILLNLNWCFSKLSVLALYHSLMPFRGMTVTVRVLAVVTAIWTVGAILGTIFSCSPIYASWDVTVALQQGAECIDFKAFYFTNSLISLLLDIAILILPMPYLYNMRLQMKRKLLSMGLFSLGAITIIVAVARQCTIPHLDITDRSYNLAIPASLSSVEALATIVVACLPFLRTLRRPVSPDRRSPLIQSTPTERAASQRESGASSYKQRGNTSFGWWGRKFEDIDMLPDATPVPTAESQAMALAEAPSPAPAKRSSAMTGRTITVERAWEVRLEEGQGRTLSARSRPDGDGRRPGPSFDDGRNATLWSDIEAPPPVWTK